MALVLGLACCGVGYLGARWFYRISRMPVDRAANSALEPLFASLMVIIGMAGVFLVYYGVAPKL